MKTITISNLKNIRYLEFDLPDPGVWLLTGENGCGKTTLLAAIRRIGFSNAFAAHFQASQQSDRLDDYSNARITYRFGQKEVTYQRSGVRWVPIPKRNSSILKSFNYPAVDFIGATPDRISPREEDFIPTKIRTVDQAIIDAANDIFATNRFSNLRVVNITRGSNPAYVFMQGTGRDRKYVSERNFSIGEICVLKLLKRLHDCPDNSLLLVDELEMALHPSAQVRLFHYMSEFSKAKSLTIIFSTHSVTLIKTAKREKIIYLKKSEDGSCIQAVKKPYTSVVLGSLASVEERSADLCVYVEDDFAQFVVDTLLNYVVNEKLGSNPIAVPRRLVVPIGGFREVIKFLEPHDALHRPGIDSCAILDGDVRDEHLADWRAKNNYAMLSWYENNSDKIKFLPWAPEVGLYEMFRKNKPAFVSKIRDGFGDSGLHMHSETSLKLDNIAASVKRKRCKKWADELIKFLCEQTMQDYNLVKRKMGSLLAKEYFRSEKNLAMRELGGLFS